MTEQIGEKVEKISVAVDKLTDNFGALAIRLKDIEDKLGRKSDNQGAGIANSGQVTEDHLEKTPGPGGSNTFTAGDILSKSGKNRLDKFDNLQAEYHSIDSSLVGVQLPVEWTINCKSKKGIKREDHNCQETISQCASYVSTALKILGSYVGSDLPRQEVQDVITVMRAQQQFLEDRYSNLLVKGRHSKEVSSMYEMLNAGTSGLSERHRENLAIAVQTSGSTGGNTQQSTRDYQPRFRNRRYRRYDQNNSYQYYNKGFPPSRPSEDNRD